MFIKILLIGVVTFTFNVYALEDKDSEKYEGSNVSSLMMTSVKNQENTLITDEEFSAKTSSTAEEIRTRPTNSWIDISRIEAKIQAKISGIEEKLQKSRWAETKNQFHLSEVEKRYILSETQRTSFEDEKSRLELELIKWSKRSCVDYHQSGKGIQNNNTLKALSEQEMKVQKSLVKREKSKQPPQIRAETPPSWVSAWENGGFKK